MAREFQGVQFALPSPERWHVALMVGLLVGYVVELIAYNAGAPVYTLLAWFNFGMGFAPWQPLTHFLVQGSDRQAVSRVVFSLLMLYFFLPMVERAVSRRQLGFAMLAGVTVGVVLPGILDLGGLAAPGAALGWTPLVYALPAIYGLARPDDTILLLFFPVRAKWILWGTLGFALLLVLAEHSLDAYQGVSVWIGVYAWWNLLGPGARRRRLLKKATGIEKELKIRVIEGGKSKPLGRQGDDWVH